MTGEELRAFLIEKVRPAILSCHRRDSCVATTKVAVEILHYLGVKAKPFACSLLVVNRHGVRIMADGDELTENEIQDLRDAGAFAVQVQGQGWVDDLGMWDGHLVVVAEMDDGLWLLDLSLDQASRPVWEINVAPHAVRVRPEQLEPGEMVLTQVGDSWVRWSAIPSRDWRRHADWKSSKMTGPLAGQLIRELRDLTTAR